MAEKTKAEVELTPATVAVVRERAAAGCMMCRWVLAAITTENVLRDWPPTEEGEPQFPVEGQRYHVLKEIGK